MPDQNKYRYELSVVSTKRNGGCLPLVLIFKSVFEDVDEDSIKVITTVWGLSRTQRRNFVQTTVNF